MTNHVSELDGQKWKPNFGKKTSRLLVCSEESTWSRVADMITEPFRIVNDLHHSSIRTGKLPDPEPKFDRKLGKELEARAFVGS